MRTLWALALLAAVAESLTIQDAAITSGNGEDEDNPADEESSITLRCGLSNADNGWVYCGWTHELVNTFDDNDEIVEVFCSSADYTQSSTQCKNLGGSEVLDQANYASRLRMDVSASHCGIRIDQAHPYDTGEWKCHVTEIPGGSTLYSSVDLYVSNHSQVYISEPDMWEDSSQVIEYEANNRGEIQAACTGIGGRPAPTFHWYVDDSNNREIDEDELNSKDSEWDDNGVPMMEQSISWEPSIDDMCDEYELDNRVCDFDRGSKERERAIFTFNLICKADQGNLYKDENDDGEVMVPVDWNGSSALYMSLPLTLLAAALAMTR